MLTRWLDEIVESGCKQLALSPQYLVVAKLIGLDSRGLVFNRQVCRYKNRGLPILLFYSMIAFADKDYCFDPFGRIIK